MPDSPHALDPRRLVRVSMSVLLRIREDERFVLFHAASRPGSFGPPGGVVKYFPPAAAVLDALGFQEERPRHDGDRDTKRADLRGFLPTTCLRDFLHWFDSGAYRETAEECLERELVEELTEVDLRRLVPGVTSLDHRYVRTVSEGPHEVPGKPYRQYRRFVVHDAVAANATALRLVRELVAAGDDPGQSLVVTTGRDSIVHGRHGPVLVAPQSALLVGARRILPDVPPMR
ncbi:hypothetical protein V5P93_007110 [Actinokineospora auranticolor]|uniref:SMODS-associated NUDIX domain-containing protein n=1 Tax=Actinokineospora auranticolor TaxID=155976 RepID=UPI0011AFDF69|nr:hypothetical protein [Actinokineospora auranticolor]